MNLIVEKLHIEKRVEFDTKHEIPENQGVNKQTLEHKAISTQKRSPSFGSLFFSTTKSLISTVLLVIFFVVLGFFSNKYSLDYINTF